MCFGGSSAPQIVYSGPSAADIEAQNASLQTYMQQSAAQQQQFATSLQQQIDQANAQAAEQRQRLDQERAAAMADMTAQQQAAYSVTTAEADPVMAQTTTAAAPKPKPKSSLKIAAGSVETTAGSGLNIGV
jgi:regulator of protease activity HflC (stomatin/prohibitin superfamily)